MTCLPGKGNRRIGQRWNHHVNVWTRRELSVLRIVVGALHVLHAWRNGDCASQVSALAGHALEIRQGLEGHIHFARRAAELITIDFLEEIARQMLRFDELRECKPRIDMRTTK